MAHQHLQWDQWALHTQEVPKLHTQRVSKYFLIISHCKANTEACIKSQHLLSCPDLGGGQ